MPYTILYIEDESAIHELVQDVLKHPDLTLVQALSAESGVKRAKRTKPDLIMLDVMMPDRDGWDIYEEIRAHPTLKEVPIIMLTGQLHRYRVIKEFADSAIDAYITKPFDARRVRVEVQAMLAATLWDMTTGRTLRVTHTPEEKNTPPHES
jgi:DNA-binding response OmpR family regulator